MRENEFQSQIERIERQFGKYGTERCAILWREVKDFSGEWFSRVVDGLIAGSRQIPIPADFYEEIAKERDRRWKAEKEAHAKDAKDFYEGTAYQPEDEKTFCQYIGKRLRGNVTNQDFETFQKHLKEMARMTTKAKCNECSDSGILIDRHNYS